MQRKHQLLRNLENIEGIVFVVERLLLSFPDEAGAGDVLIKEKVDFY